MTPYCIDYLKQVDVSGYNYVRIYKNLDLFHEQTTVFSDIHPKKGERCT